MARLTMLLAALLIAAGLMQPGTPAAAQPASDAPKLKLAIAGVVHGHVHGFMRRFKDRTNFEVVGVYEPDPALRAAFGKRYGLDDSKMFADLEVYGESGYAIATGGNSVRVKRRGKPEEARTPEPLPADVKDELAYLEGIVRGRIKPSGLSSLENNIIVTEILDAARESARAGKTVKLPAR